MSSDQSAVFIDAGFLLSVGSSMVTGTSLRSATSVDTEALIRGTVDATTADSDLETLRVYWYDASRDGVYDESHKRIALIDDVKVRLGRIGFNGNQKGVDLRLGLDLVEVARNRAAKVAYLLTGDDDLAEAVEAAQDFGMKVILVGLANDGHYLGVRSVAEHLALQVDRIITLPNELITRCFVPRARPKDSTVPSPAHTETPRPRPPAEPALPVVLAGPDRAPSAAPTPAMVRATLNGTERTAATGSPGGLTPATLVYTSDANASAVTRRLLQVAEQVGRSVAESWYATCTQADFTDVIGDRPLLPIDIDATLLRDCASKIGEGDTDRQDVRRHLRQTFWDTIDQLH